eukprot:TRINITY_DN3150_c0_g4_i1.p1 TRINITY_DN3150_c0_g4~~TRINITY_DN3150_c0_g4_i1.p1  ORF type:complete len:619 (+),score=180.69 TRINITY_DN3150_c0_g4_i1:117-1973(+)
MERPSSRGGIMRPSSAAGRGAPVQGGSGGVIRPSSRAGAPMGPGQGRPGTSSMGAAPGTASRMATGMRPGTRGRGVPLDQSVGFNSTVQVADRPVTSQGMMGVKVVNAGPGRQIQDKSYYLNLIRSRITELGSETDSMNKEIDQTQKNSEAIANLDKRYDALCREVKGLQSQLADYNLFMEKVNLGIELSELQEEYDEIKSENKDQAAEGDKTLKKRKGLEAEIAAIEKEMRDLEDAAEKSIESLSEEKREKFQRIKRENLALLSSLQEKQTEYDRAYNHRMQLEQQVKKEPVKQRVSQLYEQIRNLQKRKTDVEQEIAMVSMNGPEDRDKLLKRVRDENAAIASMDKEIQQLKEKIDTLREQMANLDMMMDEFGGEKSRKLEELQELDREMQSFIDTFEESRQKEAQQKSLLQDTIAHLLMQISKSLVRQTDMPTVDRFKEMQADLDYKTKQMENSQNTYMRLQEEHVARASELEKIKSLDSKIAMELQTLAERMETMKKELEVFSNKEQLKANAESTKEKLLADKRKLSKRRDTLKQQTQLLSSKYDTKKLRIAEDETGNKLDSLEQKLRQVLQTNFHLNEYIATKLRETNFQPHQEKSRKKLGELNRMLTQMALK